MFLHRSFVTTSVWLAAVLLVSSCTPAVAPTPTRGPAAPVSKGETPPATLPTPLPAAPSPSPKPSTDQPRAGGILNVGHNGDPVSYDPLQENTIVSLSPVIPCYSGVIQHDPLEPTKVIGDLAQRWEMSSDGMVYTFFFNKGVKWHDNTPFTAEDARFSLDLVRQPPRGVTSPRKEWLKPVSKIESVDTDTLKVTLQYPSASFLDNLGDGRMVVVPKHVFEAKGNMKRDIVGTGPYAFKSFTGGSAFSISKNATYFIKDRPYLDGITWYVILDVATRFAALRTHRIHVTPWGSYGITPSQSEMIKKEPSSSVVTQRHPGINFSTLWMVNTKSPWNDVRVRRAVQLAIDRPRLIKVAAEGVADVAGFIPPSIWSLPDAELMKMPGYREAKDADIAEARRLLAEAGYAQGFKTTTMARNVASHEKIAVTVKEQLAQVGIDTAVNLRDQAAMYDLLNKRAFDTAVFDAVVSYLDPDQILGLFVSDAPPNYSDFKDEQFDKWYDQQARILDFARRKEIVFEMQRRLLDLVPNPVLFSRVYELGFQKEVRDLKAGIGIYNNMKFQNVWLAN